MKQIPPPWVAHPGRDPWDFKQGEQEAWFLAVFVPFWKGLGATGREEYLERNPPPDETWDEYMRAHWA